MRAGAVPQRFKLSSEMLVPGTGTVSLEAELWTVLKGPVLINFDVYASVRFCWVNKAHTEGWYVRQDA